MRWKLISTATLGVAILALGASIAYAVIPDAGGVIHTCFKVGTWRPIDYPSEQCKSGEQQFDLYSKGGADNRFLTKTGKAADSDLLDGLDSTAFMKNGDTAGGDLTGTYPNPTIGAGKVTTSKIADGAVTTSKIADGAITTSKFDGSAKAPDADKLDGLDSSSFLSSNRMVGSGFVEVQPGQSYTLLSANEVELIGVCRSGPLTAEVAVASTAGGAFGVYSTQSTSQGDLGGSVSTGSPVAIASTSGSPLVDGGRFNLVGYSGGALNGTFLSYLGGGFCNFEMTAITDNLGIIGASASASAQAAVIKRPDGR
jgi:hypothetical protein